MITKAFSEKSGVHSSASSPMRLFMDPIVAANTETSDFKISELMNGEVPASLYLVIPPSDLDRMRPLFRLVMNMFLNFQMNDMKFENGKQIDTYKHRLLLMMDEFTSIGKMEIFQKGLAYMAGYGLKAYIIIQDRAQLTSQETGYGKDEQITSNCHIRVAYAPNKQETAEYLSRMAGKMTVIQKKRSSSSKSSDVTASSSSENINEVSREILKPEEISTLEKAVEVNGKVVKPGKIMLFVAGMHPFIGRQYLWFLNKTLSKRAEINAPTIKTGE